MCDEITKEQALKLVKELNQYRKEQIVSNKKLLEENKQLKEEIKRLRQRDTYTNIVHNQFQNEKNERRYYENILDELEEWLKEEINKENKSVDFYYSAEEKCKQIERVGYLEYVLNKLAKLKGSDK